VRLFITGPAENQWARLEPDTAEEACALEASAQAGEWTAGRGPEAGAELLALAERLGYPVVATEHREAPTPPPPRLVVVRRGQVELSERLRELTRLGVPVIWDHRERERRGAGPPVATDRRQRDRRSTPQSWGSLGFLVIRDPPLEIDDAR
jgi:hypothetical protein